jgi:histone deacetylase complex regulatory component SIN3
VICQSSSSQVQQEFADRKDVYMTFLSIMKEFKAGK